MKIDASTELGKMVLIETLWNVKNVGYHMDYREEQVLIETLWNVKYCNLHPG